MTILIVGMVLKRKVVSVILFIFFLALASTVYSAVLINEILANGLSDPEYEWVELLNNGTSSVNLTNWNISESFSGNFTLSTTIAPNEFIILAVDFSTFNATYPKINQSGIRIIDITITNFNLADTSGEVRLYNSSGTLVDSVAYVQASGKTFENVSIGRYPDGSSSIFNISTLTPGAKNDNQNPILNKWLSPSRNNTNVSGLTTIIVNITDDTTQVNSTFILINSTNYSMAKNGDLWAFLWNTSLNIQKLYNITVYFNDSYGKSSSDRLLNILVNNSPRIEAFSPASLAQTLAEGSILNLNVNASDPDDSISFSWYIDNVLNSTNPSNFSYTPGFSDNGTRAINATIRDASSNQISIKWIITVTNVNLAPNLGSITNKAFSKNINSSFNITASDSDNDVLAFSSNHSGIVISKVNNSMATASWKPSNFDLGANVINFTASDGSLADSEIVAITVNVTNNFAPDIATSAKTIAIANEQYSYDVDAADADNDTLLFSLETNASGMSINSATGLITFSPTSTGFFSVNISASDLTEITNQSYLLTAAFGTRLKIEDVDVKIDGKRRNNVGNNTRIGKEAKPGSSVEFKINVRNGFAKSEGIDMEEIVVRATIEEIDADDDMEEESNEFDLRPESDKSVTLKFDVPINADDGAFDVLIEAEGEDENGDGHGQFYKMELGVEKEKHDLRFINFEVVPLAGCKVNADYEIINAGAEDEEEVGLEIKSKDLLFNEMVSIDSGTEDNTYSKSVNLEIDEQDEKVTANIYTSGDLQDSLTKDIKIGNCIREKAEQDVVLLAGEQPASSIPQAVKKQVQVPAISISVGQDSGMLLLVFSTFVFTSFFIFAAIILFIKM
ncbi:lamin tail domain-containing protein [Candidatus Woesearchaeota archaeon]|nr:lamin tail domain-containing protein [Candidatus Woesearchaeota archaeon]